MTELNRHSQIDSVDPSITVSTMAGEILPSLTWVIAFTCESTRKNSFLAISDTKVLSNHVPIASVSDDWWETEITISSITFSCTDSSLPVAPLDEYQ